MKSLITGGAGFIGSHLTEKLVAMGHKVIVIDNFFIGKKKNLKKLKKNLTIINADVKNYNKIEKYFKNIDNVFHLAALADIVPSIENPQKYYEANVSGTMNVLEASKKYKIKRFLYSASSSCYGIPNKYPTKETSDIKPEYPYALTKWLGEELVMHYSNIYKLNATSLRFFNVYGPRARTSGTYGAVFGVFLAQKLAKLPFTVVGDGKQTRDFTYVDDVVEAIYKVSVKNNLRGKVFNVGSGRTVSVNKIVSLLEGKKIKIPKRPGEPDITFADISNIKKKVNWKPKISIEKGIKKLLENIDDFGSAPIWTPKKISNATKTWFKYLSKTK